MTIQITTTTDNVAPTRTETLERFVKTIIQLTGTVQPAMAAKMLQTLNRMARDLEEGK